MKKSSLFPCQTSFDADEGDHITEVFLAKQRHRRVTARAIKESGLRAQVGISTRASRQDSLRKERVWSAIGFRKLGRWAFGQSSFELDACSLRGREDL